LNAFDKEPVQTLSIELHPVELGRLTIRVEQTSHQLSAQIFTNEAASSDLLLKEKDFLLEALADLGFGETSLDISHGQPDHSDSGSRHASPNSNVSIQDTVNQNIALTPVQVSTTGINFVA
jgi:flagellar hook-length control protein FliK